MEIPQEVLDKAVSFANRYSNITDQEELRKLVYHILERGIRTIECFGGSITWE